MKLKEFEGKSLFKETGIKIPSSTLIKSVSEIPDSANENFILKAQTLAGKRKKLGGILFPENKDQVKEMCEKIFDLTISGESVNEILIEEKIDIAQELYVGFFFDTKSRAPILILSSEGGIDVEETKQNNPRAIATINIDPLSGPTDKEIDDVKSKLNLNVDKLNDFIKLVWKCYKEHDMKVIEINPVALTKNNDLIAVDSVVVLDQAAMPKHNYPFPERNGIREMNEREIAAREISDSDHKGVAGKIFLDLDGDIAVLASGGGASIVAMDALESYGGKPANYTEYSGNPPEEKVYKLTKLTLNKPNLTGCFIVGGRANFTRIDVTLAGVMKALTEIKPAYPIIIKRAGPGMKEAFENIDRVAKEHNLNVVICSEDTPISAASKIAVEEVEKFKNGNTN